MRFRLYYKGPLKPNGDPKHKQFVRRVFHKQLDHLWRIEPLKGQASKFLDPGYELSVVQQVDEWNFTSVVNEKNHLIAELDITILNPESPGSVITQGGDIDNRLKTLLDALSIPQRNQIPKDDAPRPNEGQFHCLLEDDHLVTGLKVSVDQLLGETATDDVLVLVYVDIKNTHTTLVNLAMSI